MTDIEKRERFNQYGQLAAKKLEQRLKIHVLFEHRNVNVQFDRNQNVFLKIFICWRHCMKINLDNWWLTDDTLYESGDIQEEAFNRLISLFEKIRWLDSIDSVNCVRRFQNKIY